MSIFIVAEGTHGGSKLSYEIDILLNKFDLQNNRLLIHKRLYLKSNNIIWCKMVQRNDYRYYSYCIIKWILN